MVAVISGYIAGRKCAISADIERNAGGIALILPAYLYTENE